MKKLDQVDLSLKMSRTQSEQRLAHLGRRLLQLRLVSGGLIGDGRLGPALAVVFEGWDAAGKGGAIKRFGGRPGPTSRARSVLCRPHREKNAITSCGVFGPNLPGAGGMAVFDIFWYGRVLVERVEGFATEPEWKRAYEEITSFEKGLVAEGSVIVKFWLHISSEEQLARFESRQGDPLRSWKLTEEDWRNRAKRPAYVQAVEEMLSKTDHSHARWHVVAAENKQYARVKVVETVVHALEHGLDRAGITVPPAAEAELLDS